MDCTVSIPIKCGSTYISAFPEVEFGRRDPLQCQAQAEVLPQDHMRT